MIKNCCHNNHCSNCGQCCIPYPPITFDEYKAIKDYVDTHHIKAVPLYEDGNLYVDCPFHDRVLKKCNIYPVRPEVCRNFLCSHSPKRIEKDRKFYDEHADINGVHLDRVIPFDLLFFDDPTMTLMLVQDVGKDRIVDVLYKMGSGITDDTISNPSQVADAIKDGRIVLTWKEE